jgi:hypothetical protein
LNSKKIEREKEKGIKKIRFLFSFLVVVWMEKGGAARWDQMPLRNESVVGTVRFQRHVGDEYLRMAEALVEN